MKKIKTKLFNKQNLCHKNIKSISIYYPVLLVLSSHEISIKIKIVYKLQCSQKIKKIKL